MNTKKRPRLADGAILQTRIKRDTNNYRSSDNDNDLFTTSE